MYFYVKLVHSFTFKIHWGENKTSSKSRRENCGDNVRCCLSCFPPKCDTQNFDCSQNLPDARKVLDVAIFCLPYN